MHLSVEKSTRRASVTSGSHQFLRAASARKRRKSLGSNSHTKETILFEVRHLSKNLLSRSRYITIQPMALFRFSLLLQQQCLVSQFLHSWSETQCIIMNDLRRQRGCSTISYLPSRQAKDWLFSRRIKMCPWCGAMDCLEKVYIFLCLVSYVNMYYGKWDLIFSLIERYHVPVLVIFDNCANKSNQQIDVLTHWTFSNFYSSFIVDTS